MKSFTLVSLFTLLFAFQSTSQVTLIPYNDSWKYLDNGTNQGTAWQSSSFNTTSWKTGNGKFGYGIADATTVIGFGTNSSKKYITTYFRKTINIANPTLYPSFIGNIKRDDGAVVYVNGKEVYRNNMPKGKIDYSTLAAAIASDNGTTPQTFTIDPGAFVNGSNVIAVEIHQQSVNTPDMAFDMSLGTPEIIPPTVTSINRQVPASASTTASSVTFRAIFSEKVTGVDASDFIITRVSGATTGGTLSPYLITAVGTDGTTFDVSVLTYINVSVTIRLDLKNNGTGITDVPGNAIAAGYTGGQTYSIDHTPPTVVSINRQLPLDATTSASSVIFRITFSESVTGVDASDFTLNKTSTANGTIASNAVTAVGSTGLTYDITVGSLTGSGTLRLDLNSSGTGIIDAATNVNSGGYSSGQLYTIDRTMPVVTSINRQSPITATTAAVQVTYRVTFSKPVTGVDATDFSLTSTGSVAGILSPSGVTAFGIEGSVYDVSVNSITGDGTMRLNLNSSGTGISDNSGNAISGGFTAGQSYTFDHAVPVVLSINRQVPVNIITAATTVVYRVNFSESVTGVDASDFTLFADGNTTATLAANAVVAAGTNGMSYDVTVNTVSGSGTLRLDMNATGTGITDAIGNALGGGFTSGQSYTIDQTAPVIVSIKRQIPLAAHTPASSVTFRVIFSESVTGVDVADFTLINGGSISSVLAANSVSGFGTDGTTYDITVSSVSGNGTIHLDLNSLNTGISDLAANQLSGGFTSGETYTIDQVLPTVGSINRQAPSSSTTSSASITYRIIFSEQVTGVDVSDFSLTPTGTVAGNLAVDAVNALDGTTYDVTVNPVTGEGSLRLDLNASGTGISDIAGNLVMGGFTSGEIYTIDHITPVVVGINRQSPVIEITPSTTVLYRISFSKQVTGVDVTDFTLANSGTATGILAADAVAPVGVDGVAYDVTVNTVSGVGTLRLDLNASGTGIADLSGNALSGGYTTGQAYTIDQIAPTVISINRQSPVETITSSASLTYRIIFSEPVTGVDPVDFTFLSTNTASGTFESTAVATVGTDGTTYDITATSVIGSGSLRLDLKSIGTGITDAAGNASGGFTSGEKYIIDHIVPSVVSINRQSPTFATTSSPAVTFRVTFSELVNGVDVSDFSLTTTGTVAGTLAATAVTAVGTQGNAFDVTVSSITGEGTLTLNLNGVATGITDALGNAITDGFNTGESYTLDHIILIVASINRMLPISLTTTANTVTYRVTFSKPVTGVDPTDFALTVLYGTVSAALDANSISTVGTDGSVYDVTVNNILNAGTLRLDINGSNTGIVDAAGNALSAGFVAGQYYTVRPDDLAPAVLSINRQSPVDVNTSAGSITYRVSFSEPVTGVDSIDFIATPITGNVRGTMVTLSNESSGVVGTQSVAMADAAGTTYDVSVRALAGNGDLRLDLRSTNSGIVDATATAVAGGYTSGQTYSIQSTSGFSTFSNITPLSIASHTAEKPQAKTWYYAGKWWTVMSTDLGTKIFRLDGSTWTDVLTLGASTNVKADCIVAGNVVHILAFRGTNNSFIYSVEFDAATNSYKLWTLRPTRATILFETGAKTATITLDGNGRMWVANDGLSAMYLRYSDAPYSTWSAPITLVTGVMDDDICALVSLPGKIGLMWSNQITQRFGFETHINGTNPTLWTADETPGASGALQLRYGLADDHINLMAASDGTLYAAIKDGYDTPSQPKVGLLVRRPAGTWDDLYPVTANEGTRPIVLLNETSGKLKVVYSSHETGGDILYRESSTSNISFSRPYTLIGGNPSYIYNYATSTHQTYSSEILILATDMTTGPSPIQLVGVIAQEGVATSLTTVAPTATSTLGAAMRQPVHTEKEPVFLAYPNPFGAGTRIAFTVPAQGEYTLTLYNSLGAKLSVLSRGKSEEARENNVQFQGALLSPGLYFVKLQTPTGTKTIKLIHK